MTADDLTILLEAYDVLAQLGRENAKEARLEHEQNGNEKPSGRESDG